MAEALESIVLLAFFYLYVALHVGSKPVVGLRVDGNPCDDENFDPKESAAVHRAKRF